MLTMPEIREDYRRSWEVTSHLPFEEAFALLEPEVRRPDADDRSAVYRAVINSAGQSREPASIEQALTWAARIRNERDQVRNTVLLAAAGLPPSLLSDQHVAALQTLLTDALEARDTSWSSRSALNQLAELAVRQGALGNHQGLLRWGLDAHARLTESRGTVSLYGLIDGLPRGREVAIYETLRPYVESAAKRREFDLAFAIAGAFGRRGWTIDHLYEVLEQAVWSNQEYTVERAAQLWLEPTTTRSERTGRIIGRDVGMARWQPVWDAVTEYRTDLLDPVLAKPDRIRRFSRNHPAWQISDPALHRWLPRQHRRYAELVAAAANDSRMPEWARAAAVSTLGRIPRVGRTAVEPFLTSDAVLLQEAALAALAWTDRPEQALPVLLRHGGDDRARVALYAATRAARFVRPSLLAEMFRPVLVGEGVKVTSRKEAARLLGELRAPGASEVMTEAWADAHRDVKAAITSAASQYLLHEPHELGAVAGGRARFACYCDGSGPAIAVHDGLEVPLALRGSADRRDEQVRAGGRAARVAVDAVLGALQPRGCAGVRRLHHGPQRAEQELDRRDQRTRRHLCQRPAARPGRAALGGPTAGPAGD